MRAQSLASTASCGVSQEPPQTLTLGSLRKSGAVCSEMPPVGQKATSGNGPPSAFSRFTPPTAVAGNSFRKLKPAALACITSDAVDTPGSSGRPSALQAAASASV